MMHLSSKAAMDAALKDISAHLRVVGTLGKKDSLCMLSFLRYSPRTIRSLTYFPPPVPLSQIKNAF